MDNKSTLKVVCYRFFPYMGGWINFCWINTQKAWKHLIFLTYRSGRVQSLLVCVASKRADLTSNLNSIVCNISCFSTTASLIIVTSLKINIIPYLQSTMTHSNNPDPTVKSTPISYSNKLPWPHLNNHCDLIATINLESYNNNKLWPHSVSTNPDLLVTIRSA